MKRYLSNENALVLRGKQYQLGRVIENAEALSNLEYLVSSGKFTVEEIPDNKASTKKVAPATKNEEPNILDLPVANLGDAIASINDPDVLQSLIDAENAGKTRKSALEALQSRLNEILESNG